MPKVGRNAPCPCGSAKKYKRCCGASAAPSDSFPTQDDLARLKLEAERFKAREHRRQLMQGLGKPIISTESHGCRLVAVGSQIMWSKSWLTFHDFLFHLIKRLFGVDWGNAELAKPPTEQHPLLNWYVRVCQFQSNQMDDARGGVYSAAMNGVVRAYLGLAYDLYLSAHNAEIPPHLLKRLRNKANFEGAVYEAYVIGCFAKAGFEIQFEDENDPTTTHCEFTAVHQLTGRKFSVEAKAITSVSSRAGFTEQPPKIRGKLYEALKKAAPHERIVFIELHRAQRMLATGVPDWVADVESELLLAESEIQIAGSPPPPAYVFVTNRPSLVALDSPDTGEIGFLHGFKMPDFPAGRAANTLMQAVEARERHIELHWLKKAIETHNQIPSTFDHRTPEEAFSLDQPSPLRIGERYIVPDGKGGEVVGVLYDAVVLEAEKKAYGVLRLADGRSTMFSMPLTDSEIVRYRESRDTFFDVVKPVSQEPQSMLEMYDFFYSTYSQTPKQKLLEFMNGWPASEELRSLSQDELARRYCVALTENAWSVAKR